MAGDPNGGRGSRGSWLDRLTGEEAGRRRLALASFLESTVIPIPLEALVAPLMLADSRNALRVALAIWLGCLAGALLFYFAGSWLFDPVVAPLLDLLGLARSFDETVRELDSRSAFWAIFLISLSPVPFQLATLGAGSLDVGLVAFMAAVALSRGIRYFGLALLALLIGPRVAAWLRGRTATILGAVLAIVAIYAVVRLLA